MKREICLGFLGGFLALLLTSPLAAQPFTMPPPGGIVVTAPYGKSTTQAKVTIAVTNTFQVALAANTLRLGCAIQNTGANTAFVFFGSATPADTTTSFRLAQNQSLNCAIGGGAVATDQILVTGTANDVLIVSSQ